jgi:hypothetical protein
VENKKKIKKNLQGQRGQKKIKSKQQGHRGQVEDNKKIRNKNETAGPTRARAGQ